MPWLLLASDNRFHVLAEVFVERNCGVALPRFPKDFRDEPSTAVWRAENGHWPVILLDDEFQALLHLGQYGMEIPGQFSFCDVEGTHRLHHNLSSLRSALNGRSWFIAAHRGRLKGVTLRCFRWRGRGNVRDSCLLITANPGR